MQEYYRIDDLQRNNMKLKQDTREFCFGMDSVLLADFAARFIKNGSAVAELCCGNGAVSVLMLARNGSFNITGVEISSSSASLCEENIQMNGLSNSFAVLCRDLKFLPKEYSNSFDAVVVNPPYNASERGITSENSAKRLSRSEQETSLQDVLVCAKRILKNKGGLYMVHRPARINDISKALLDNSFALKKIRFIHPKKDRSANAMLLHATKNGGSFADVLPPLTVYDSDGKYTDEVYEIYYG